MVRKTTRKLVYVLSSNSSDTGHSLGINALALDPGSPDMASGTVYSGGRDGLINSWSLQGMNLSVSQDSRSSLSGVRAVSKPGTPRSKQDKTAIHGETKPAQKVQIHTNWVNDIVLTHDYSNVISCSSDLTVKSWNPQTNQQTLIGRHSDYVKCLTETVGDSWLVSGGLDRKMIAWDLGENRGEKFSIDVGDRGKNPKGSIYALASSKNNPTNPLIASGGPEGIVSLWDPRDTGRKALKLIGHTDNIRSLLVSQDSKWVLSASSDSTVKLWSTAAGRLMHSFDMHNDSVWSLYSLNDNLDVFYSTDRIGIVAKTELRNCPSKADLDEGFCTVICNEHQGVSKVVATDKYLWTATSNSRIHRWQNVDTGPIAVTISATNTLPSPADEGMLASKKGTIGSLTNLTNLTSKLAEIRVGDTPHSQASLSPNVNGGSTATNTAPSSPSLKPTEPARNEIKTSFLGLFGGPAIGMLVLEQQYKQDAKKIDLGAPLEDLSITIQPRYENPVETLEGRIGLLKHRLLADRRRVLTLDTAGDIKMWCLVTGRVLQSFQRGLYNDIDDLADQMSSFAFVSNWCQVAIRTGELFVYLDSNTCFDAEVYGDELIEEEDISQFDPENTAEMPVDHRLNFGKWVIVNLLRGLTDSELAKVEKMGLQTDDNPREFLLKKNTDVEVQHIVEPEQPKPQAAASTETPEKSGGKFMGKLRGFGKKKDKKDKKEEASVAAKQSSETAAATATVAAAVTRPPVKEYNNLKEYTDDLIQHRKPGEALFRPPTRLDAPKVTFPSYTKLMISEQSPNSGGSMDIYRGTVGSTGADVEQLEKVVPDWIAKVILNNEMPRKEPIKVGFVFHPLEEGVDEISGPNVRLTAFQMLRVYKMATYVEDRLTATGQLRDSHVELYCQNQKLSGNATLATVRTRYWRSGGDMVIKYKLVPAAASPGATVKT